MFRVSQNLVICLSFTAFAGPAPAADPPKPAEAKVEFRLAENEPSAGLVEAVIAGTDRKVYLHQDVLLTNAEIDQAQAVRDANFEGGKYFTIAVKFTEAGGKTMAELSEKFANKSLAIVVDGTVISAPKIIAKIGARAVITGRFSEQEAERLAKSLAGK